MADEQESAQRQLARQRRLVQALRDPACYAHPVGAVRVLETHISFVVLTGAYAYKIKKSVNLGFVDFTTLEKRRFYCGEEMRLNSRLAPEIYLDVVAIGGEPEAPRVGHATLPIEYAVRMREFPQEALADRALARGELHSLHMDAVAAQMAQLHSGAGRSGADDGFGTPDAIAAAAEQNFTQMRALPELAGNLPLLEQVESWSRREHARLREVFAQRKRDGAIRECHGDLHLGNIAILDGVPCIFDCVEFNPDFRWIDVISEVAFLDMDLRAAGRADLARRFINAYLESSGDYDGLQVLRFYLAFRATVRAKVDLLRADQLAPGSQGLEPLLEQCRRYLALACSCALPARAFVAITHGFSGSGKTTLSGALIELSGAIRIRSDVERKRIAGLAPTARSGSGIASGLYSADATESTYARLLELAQIIVGAGYGAVVDATFLKRAQRDSFRDLAARGNLPFFIIDFTAAEDTLRERIRARSEGGHDPSEADLAVLEYQLRTAEPLQPDELTQTFRYDANAPLDQAHHAGAWNGLFRRLSPSTAAAGGDCA